jgi:hypothetical protein
MTLAQLALSLVAILIVGIFDTICMVQSYGRNGWCSRHPQLAHLPLTGFVAWWLDLRDRQEIERVKKMDEAIRRNLK